MSKITNEELLEELIKSQETGIVTETLGKMMVYVATKVVDCRLYLHPHYSLLREDMIQEAVMNMVKAYNTFNPEKSTNILNFLNTSAHCSAVAVIRHHLRQKETIKDYEQIA